MNKDKNVKILPDSNSNFRDIMLNNCAYVDKTRFIEMLENEANRNKFIVRPYGFGKSLFISTLESYYDIKQKDDFERLFGGLYIGQHPTPERNSYAVLKFDFSGIDSFDSENFAESFSQNVRETARNFLEYYRDYIPEFEHEVQQVENAYNGTYAMDRAIWIVTFHGKLRVCLLIDEYDRFARHLVATGRYSWEEEGEKYGTYMTLRNFYLRIESAKIGCQVYRTFITGVSYAVWSAVSNLMPGNISYDYRYNEIMGFTKEEVQNLSVETRGRDLWDFEEKRIEWRYGGYIFDMRADNKVYNPEAVIGFMKYEMQHFGDKDMVDENLIANYRQLQGLIQNGKTYKTIMEIYKGNRISCFQDYTYLMENLTNEENIGSLLLNLGLLTYEKQTNIDVLKTPNYLARCILNHFVHAQRNSKYPEKIIFLDIDGVLQPYGSQERFEHLKEVDEFYGRLLDEYGIDYSGYNHYDVLAVYYDWDKDAVAELKRILDTTGAKIVISSDWRDKTIDRMVDLCRIHDLDVYIIDATTKEDIQHLVDASPKLKQMDSYRSREITLYVEAHPEIKNYVAIDDIRLTNDLGEEHTVVTYNKMTREDADKCIELLNRI